MKEDEPGLSDQDKRAIEAIRRELDREFGDDYEKATIHPERPDQRATRRHTGLAVGLGILAVVALAGAAVVASRVLAPVPYANLRESAAISRVDSQDGPGSARESRLDATPGRTSTARVNRSKSPCPPSTRIAASSRKLDVSLASTSRGSVARGSSRSSPAMALANPVREPRHVEAP